MKEDKRKEISRWAVIGSCVAIILVVLGVLINGASAESADNAVEDIVNTDIDEVVGRVVLPIKERLDGEGIRANSSDDTAPDTEDEEVDNEQECTFGQGERNLTVHVLDVEHGDSIFVHGPNGGSIIIDGGYEDKPRMILDYLHNNSISYFDYAIATHMHSDHIGGLDFVLKKAGFVYKVYDNGQIPENMSFEDKRTFNSYTGVAENIDRNILMEDKVLEWDECVDVQLFIPYQNGSYNEEINDNSIITKISFFDHEFLFMGDCEKGCEDRLMEKNIDLKADFIKIGHHGDSDATSDLLLDLVDPSVALISTGDFEKFGHPHDEVIENLEERDIEILRTDKGGHIIITTDGEEYGIERVVPPEKVEIWS